MYVFVCFRVVNTHYVMKEIAGKYLIENCINIHVIMYILEQARYFILNFKLSENKIVQSCASFPPII